MNTNINFTAEQIALGNQRGQSEQAFFATKRRNGRQAQNTVQTSSKGELAEIGAVQSIQSILPPEYQVFGHADDRVYLHQQRQEEAFNTPDISITFNGITVPVEVKSVTEWDWSNVSNIGVYYVKHNQKRLTYDQYYNYSPKQCYIKQEQGKKQRMLMPCHVEQYTHSGAVVCWVVLSNDLRSYRLEGWNLLSDFTNGLVVQTSRENVCPTCPARPVEELKNLF